MFPSNFIDAERIGCRLEIGSKKRVLQQLGDLLASSTPGLSPEEVFDHLLQALAVVGGLVTSTALTLLVLPVLYGWMHREPVRF